VFSSPVDVAVSRQWRVATGSSVLIDERYSVDRSRSLDVGVGDLVCGRRKKS
jgi:hypothetical protein